MSPKCLGPGPGPGQIFGPIWASSVEAGGDEGIHSNLWPDLGFFLKQLSGTWDFYDLFGKFCNFLVPFGHLL